MNLNHLSDEELLSQTQTAVARERAATTEVLYHLLEVEVRMLYAQLAFSSLFDYVVKGLGFSESAASRRINAMRLIKQLPDVAPAIESGSLNLSSVSSAQTFFTREEREQGRIYTVEEKQEILQSMEQKSKRECEKILIGLSPTSAITSEKVKIVSESQSELRVVLTDEMLAKLSKIRSLWSHKLPHASYADLIDAMADMVLDRIDPVKKEERIQRRVAKRSASAAQPGTDHISSVEVGLDSVQGSSVLESSVHTNICSQDQNDFAGKVECNAQTSKNFRVIHAALKREVFKRDDYQCTYCDPQTGKRCESDYLLECDHIIPVALGGLTELSNLATKCRNHNIFAAKQIFGDLMKEYVPSLNR